MNFDRLGNNGGSISIFETIIRVVGGLLGAHSLSGDAVFKEKAEELVIKLLPAYEPKEGIFYTYFNPQTKEKEHQF